MKALEKHLRVPEIAEKWGVTPPTIRARFEHEPGVVHFTNGSRGKRKYTTLLIPESVVQRVHAEMTAGACR